MKLGGFTSSFAEITDKMSTETGFREGGTRFQRTIYPHVARKSSRFPAFFGKTMTLRERKDAFASTLRWGRLRRLGKLAGARTFLLDRETRMARVFEGEGRIVC